MTEEKRKSLFDALLDLPEGNKTRILAYVFGQMDACQDQLASYDPEGFFQLIQEQVDLVEVK